MLQGPAAMWAEQTQYDILSSDETVSIWHNAD